jgi:DNA mismatch repair protein MutL
MGRIQKLSPELINLIAAGEVVERPASVVKELVENALDAGATQIVIRVEEGGGKLIQVVDNGRGMDSVDAEAAFEQHATSKIAALEDLQRIATLGFRGEALASIAAVSEIEMHTKTEPEPATKITIIEQKISSSLSPHAQTGTDIQIRNLFAALPGRKKFLRTAQTEFGHLTNIVVEAALAHPEVRFELYHDGRLIHRLPAASDAAARASEIWSQFKPSDFYHAEVVDNALKLEAWVGKPDVARKDRKVQFVFVNERPVSDRLIQRAASDAFKGFIHRDLQPVYLLKLTLDPEEVDVNVHPRKQEVKFANSQHVYLVVMRTLRDLLAQQTKSELLERLAPESAPEADLITPSFVRQPSTTFAPQKIYASPIGPQAGLNFTAHLLKSSSPSYSHADLPAAPLLRPLQLFMTYIVYQQGEEVIFIDQHAAAEKILYEKLMSQAANQKSSPMLVPEVLEFSAQEKRQLLEQQDELVKIGLEIEDFSGHSVKIAAKPELTPNLRTREFLQDLLHHQQTFDDNAELLKEIGNPKLHHLVATAACHGSVRAGQRLSEPEMQQIIADLAKCQYPYNCPHGRPVSWQLARTELEKNFKRII